MKKKIIKKMAKSLLNKSQQKIENYVKWLSVLRGENASKYLLKSLKRLSTVS